MPSIKVSPPTHALSLVRYSYPILLKMESGDVVFLDRFYSDFASLYAALVTKSRRRNVPPLPPREWDGTEKVREKRRAAFEYFLEWCVTNAASDENVLDFLGIKSLSSQEPVELLGKKPSGDQLERFEEQTFIKFLFFAFMWLMAWRAMVGNPIPEAFANEPANMNGVGFIEGKQQYVDFLQPPAAAVKSSQGDVDKKHSKAQLEEFLEYVEQPMVAELENAKEETLTPDNVEVTSYDSKIPGMDIIKESIETMKDEENVEPSVEVVTSEDEAPLVVAEITTGALTGSLTHADTTAEYDEVISVAVESENNSDERFADTASRLTTSNDDKVVPPNVAFEQYLGHRDIETQAKKETKREIDFFFTPSQGLMSFAALSVLVFIYTSLFPAATAPAPVESEPESVDEIANRPTISIRLIENVELNGDDVQIMTLDEAKTVFERISATLSEREVHLGRALVMRANGAETSNGTQVLTRFWEEACALTSEKAEARFIGFVSSRLTDTTKPTPLDTSQGPTPTGKEDEESLESNNSAMQVFANTSRISSLDESSPSSDSTANKAVKWWDKTPQASPGSSPPPPQPHTVEVKPLVGMNHLTAESPIIKKQLEVSSSAILSFDASTTDVSSLSISPSPVRITTSAQKKIIMGSPVGSLKLDQSEHEILNEGKIMGHASEVTLGAIVGFAGMAFATSVIRNARSRWF